MVRSAQNRNPSGIDSCAYKMQNEIFQLMLLTFRDYLIVHTFQNRYRQKETEIDRETERERERE